MNNKRIKLFLISGDIVMAAFFARFAHAMGVAINANVSIVSELKSNNKIKNIVRKFGHTNLIDIKFTILKILFTNLRWIFTQIIEIKTGEQLCNLSYKNVIIGKHLYDSLLRREALPTILNIKFKYKIYLFIEICYFIAAKNLVDKNDCEIIILPDNTYRQGPIFEYLLKYWKGDLYVGIDMNTVAVHKYQCPVPNASHCRTPSISLFEKLECNPTILQSANEYFATRKIGNLAQHDVIRAFASTKSMTNRTELQKNFGFDKDKKIVLVMAHIFSDAPHGYPSTIYKDYMEWLIATCVCLNLNKNVNFIVKEHPSSVLYQEEGIIQKILAKHGFEYHILNNNINTASLFDSVDYIVTCGGTAAMEFAAEGVPVIVASQPPYYNFGFCYSSRDLIEYEILLNNIHNIKPLDDLQRKKALLMLYIINCYYGIDRVKAGLGSQDFYKGANFSINKFFAELEKFGPDSIQFEYLVSSLRNFCYSNETNLVNKIN